MNFFLIKKIVTNTTAKNETIPITNNAILALEDHGDLLADVCDVLEAARNTKVLHQLV